MPPILLKTSNISKSDYIRIFAVRKRKRLDYIAPCVLLLLYVKNKKTMPTAPLFVYFAEYQVDNGGYVCLKLCRYCAATVPPTYDSPSKTLSQLLGVRARSFGRTQTVVRAYANGWKQRPSPLQRCCLNLAETLFTPYQDAALWDF